MAIPLAIFDSGGDGGGVETADVNLLDDEVQDTADMNLLDDEAEGTLEGVRPRRRGGKTTRWAATFWIWRGGVCVGTERRPRRRVAVLMIAPTITAPITTLRNFEANAKGERNNVRRGLFGGWGNNRGGNVQPASKDPLSGDVASPAWSDTNASSSGRGGGFFGRLGNNNATSGASLTTEETEASYSKLPRDGIDEAGMAYDEGGITGDDDTITDTIDPELEAEQRMDNHLRPGDHIYVWQTSGEEDPLTVRPPDYQPTGEEEPLSFDMDTLYTDDEDDVEVTVVSFYHFQRPHASGSRRGKRSGCKREHLYDFLGPDAVRKEETGPQGPLRPQGQERVCSPRRRGWARRSRKDRVGLILARVQYVLDRPDHLPPHNALSANVAYPFLVPLLVTLGMASLVPLEILRRNRKKWRGITDGLNHAFWSGASEAVKEEYFGDSATAEKEAEMRTFFRPDDSKYMPVGGAPGSLDGSDEEGEDGDEDEAVALQQMEQSCQNMASDMKVDLSGRPPSESSKGAWGSFVGSFRGNNSPQSVQDNEGLNETQRFHTAYEMS
ncbi:hypothetical protein ACHAXT_009864 [Thalassiosira profunda]